MTMITERHIRAELDSLDPEVAPSLREIALLAARSADARLDFPPREDRRWRYWMALASEHMRPDTSRWGFDGWVRAAAALAWALAGEDAR